MTTKQAITKAKKLFGPNGSAHFNPRIASAVRYRVGQIEMGCMFIVRGVGDSYEAAFARAEKEIDARA